MSEKKIKDTKNVKEQEQEVSADNEETVNQEVEDAALFFVTIKEEKVLRRTTPEYRLDNSNAMDVLYNNGKRYGITKVQNGYGKLQDMEGWISLEFTKKYLG